jgi:hypothetical protein
MKPHYWNDVDNTDQRADIWLKMAIGQGYVPATCQLNGQLVMGLTNEGKDPCIGCHCPREICHGRPVSKPLPDLLVPDFREPKVALKREPVIIRVPD